MRIDMRPQHAAGEADGRQVRGLLATTRVVVGIPTFRRPDQLQALLGQVLEQAQQLRAECPCAVVVADNDGDPRIAGLVEAMAGRTDVPLLYVPVHDRGISQARNGLIEGAYQVDREWTHLVMYDDDGLLTPGCLRALVATAVLLGADAAGGPVEMGELGGSSPVVRAYLDSALPHHTTGLVDRLNGGQNVVLGRELIDRMDAPWFPPKRGLSGGEDFEFFLRATEAGARYAWAADAVVDEPLPAERLEPRAVLHRAFDENAANARTQLDLFGRAHTWRRLRGGTLGLPRYVASLLHHPDAIHLGRLAVGLSAVAGFAAGTLGFQPEPYR